MSKTSNYSMYPPSKGNIEIAVIGCGKISEQHLIALKPLDQVNVISICDLSPALAQFTAERFGIRDWFTEYKEMLKHCSADVIHVLTPPSTHDRIVRDCLESGFHVVVEKPIALSNSNFRALMDLADSKGLRLIENHNYRFNSPILELERVLKEGRIGTVQEVEVRLVLNISSGGRYADTNLPHTSHNLPAGIIHEFITHMVYLLLNFIPDSDVDKFDLIRAAWSNHSGGTLFKYDDLDAIILANNVHSRLRFSCHQWPDCFTVQVRGTDGVASAELFHPVCLVTDRGKFGQHLTPLVNSLATAKKIKRAGFKSIWRKIQNKGAYEGLGQFLELFYQSMITGGESPVSYRQMDETSLLIDALLAQEKSL